MLSHGDYAAVNHVAPNGFISLGEADKLRRESLLAEFKTKHAAEYNRAVQAVVDQRRAAAEYEAAWGELVKLCPQGKVSDLLVGIKADASDDLKRLAVEARRPPAPAVPAAVSNAQTAPDLPLTKMGGVEIQSPASVVHAAEKASKQRKAHQ